MAAPTGADAADAGGNVDTGAMGEAGGVREAADAGVDATALAGAAGVAPNAAGEAVPAVFVDASALECGNGTATAAGTVAVAGGVAPASAAGVPIVGASGARFDGAAEGVTSVLDVAVSALARCPDVATVAVALGTGCDTDAPEIVPVLAGADAAGNEVAAIAVVPAVPVAVATSGADP